MSDIPDYAATVISHNAASKARRHAWRYVLQLSAIVTRFSTKQVGITLAAPGFDLQRQISRKFFSCPDSAIGMD
jgi:hypothetical protein